MPGFRGVHPVLRLSGFTWTPPAAVPGFFAWPFRFRVGGFTGEAPTPTLALYIPTWRRRRR